MDESSSEKDQRKYTFLKKSLVWKIVGVFLLLILLSIFQYVIIFTSVTNIENELDQTFTNIEIGNKETDKHTAINDAIVQLNDQINLMQTTYLAYLSNLNDNAENEFIEQRVGLNSNFDTLRILVTGVTNDEVNPSTARFIISLINPKITEFLTVGNSFFDVIPATLRLNITSSFINFSSVINTKIATLLEWMYSGNNQTLLDIVNEENNSASSFTNAVNTSLIPIETVDNDLYLQLLNISNLINQNYVNMFPFIQSIINEVVLGSHDPTLYDQAALNIQIDNLSSINNQIKSLILEVTEIIKVQVSTLSELITGIDIITKELRTFLQDLFEWSVEAQFIISEKLRELNDSSSNQIENFIDNITLILLVILLFSFAFILLLIYISNIQLSKPIKKISFWSEKISNQDLSYNVYKSKRTDEIGVLHNNFRIMNKTLKDIIIEVKDSSSIVSETANELLSNTEEINATAEEVSAIAQSMAKGSTQQAELIATIVEELQVTSDTVDSVINQINYNLRIIHELSEQTNILALNTAIEAANAGDFGRGFAVISDNIRKMASQSKKTTDEVTRDSREVLFQLQTTFSNITGKIENVAAVSEETAASAEEVAASAQELTAVMETVSAKSSLLDERSSQSEDLIKHFVLERTEIPKSDSSAKSNGGSPAKDV